MSKTNTYGYDAWGRKVWSRNPGGTEYQYSYDAKGRLMGMEIPCEGAVAFSTDGAGLPDGVTMPGGIRKTFGYNGWQAMTTNRVADSAGNAVMSRLYARDIVGNIMGQNTEQGIYAYGYDAIEQLTNVNVSAYTGPADVATNESFVYDSMGNRLAFFQAITNLVGGALRAATYSVNSLNQYSEISNTESQITLQYDLNGNLTNRASAIETNTYTWDIENRLVSFQRLSSNGTVIANYTYDPFGRRLSKVVNGITNYFLYADEGLIGEYDGEGNLTREYGYTPGSMWMNNLVFLKTLGQGATNYYYAINDHLGALQKLVANNGSVVWSMAQDAFGRAVVSSNSTIICNLRFSSQYYDEEKGSHNNTMRDYEPEDARYTSPDMAEQYPNLYLFARNNPLSVTDPLGLWGADVHHDRTKEWAYEIMHMPESGAEAIATWDNLVDFVYPPFIISEENWSWHFDRSHSGEDSRLVHMAQELQAAKNSCDKRLGKDKWEEAAKHMGHALHPLQDFVAHGDFNRWREAPNAASAWDPLHYIHNTLSKQLGYGSGAVVDDQNFDSEGPNGRPTMSVMQFAQPSSVGDWLFWAPFHSGQLRIQFAEQITLKRLREFMEHVQQNAVPCGKCYDTFVNELPGK